MYQNYLDEIISSFIVDINDIVAISSKLSNSCLNSKKNGDDQMEREYMLIIIIA